MKDSAYKKAGVDIEAGDSLVDRIQDPVKATSRPGVMGGLGGFAAFFDVKAAGFKDPLIVSSTDGVGTKLRVAIDCGLHDTVGIDLVAMCVNDLVTSGAQPLFFLDYFATGKLDADQAAAVISGIAAGCKQSGCALVGGETAEMPGMYHKGDYDLAGFAVGAVERDGVITGADVRAGDVVLGLLSDGVHSNGFSLVRRIVAQAGADYAAPAPFDPSRTLGAALLTPTRLYVRPVLEARKTAPIKALAHITGGGLPGNVPRVIPEGLEVRIDALSWTLPPVFQWLAQAGALTRDDMLDTFNCGIGMVAVCAPEHESRLTASLTAQGENVRRIGHVQAGQAGCIVENAEASWHLKK